MNTCTLLESSSATERSAINPVNAAVISLFITKFKHLIHSIGVKACAIHPYTLAFTMNCVNGWKKIEQVDKR